MRTFKIYFLSNFQIYNIVLLTIVPMLYIACLITFTNFVYTLPSPQSLVANETVFSTWTDCSNVCYLSISIKVIGPATDVWSLIFGAAAAPRNTLEYKHSVSTPDLPYQVGVGPSQPSRWLWCALKFENHWARETRQLQLYRGFLQPANKTI